MKVSRRIVLASSLGVSVAGSRLLAAPGRTHLDTSGAAWRVNGTVTYAGAPAEGLLMNVRMVNAVFEDGNTGTRPHGFDPARNTEAFLHQVPEYMAQGIRAFTIGLQG